MPNNQNRTGRAKQRRRHHDGPPFIQLYRYMLNCPAYESLSPWARAALVEVQRGYNGSNNGRIILSVRDVAKRLGCHRDTAGRALQELIDKGFIEPRIKGAFSVKFKRATEWRLNDRRCDATGMGQSQAFMKWQGPEQPTAKSKTRSYGLGPYGPTEPDTTPIPGPSPRSYRLGH
jgi:DNA-binding transcriptional regulator YhcF (GntR family)